MDRTMKPPASARLPRLAVARISFLRLRSWRTIAALIALVAIVAASVVLVRARSATAVTYTTVPLARQDLVQTDRDRYRQSPEHDRHRFASVGHHQ